MALYTAPGTYRIKDELIIEVQNNNGDLRPFLHRYYNYNLHSLSNFCLNDPNDSIPKYFKLFLHCHILHTRQVDTINCIPININIPIGIKTATFEHTCFTYSWIQNNLRTVLLENVDRQLHFQITYHHYFWLQNNLKTVCTEIFSLFSLFKQQSSDERSFLEKADIQHFLLIAYCCYDQYSFIIITIQPHNKKNLHPVCPYINKDESRSKKTEPTYILFVLSNDLSLLVVRDLIIQLSLIFFCFVDSTVDIVDKVDDSLWEIWIVVDHKSVAETVCKVDTRSSFDLQLDRHTLDKGHLGNQDEVQRSVSGGSETWNLENRCEDHDEDANKLNYYFYFYYSFISLQLSCFDIDKVLPHEGCLLYITPAFADSGYIVPFFDNIEDLTICWTRTLFCFISNVDLPFKIFQINQTRKSTTMISCFLTICLSSISLHCDWRHVSWFCMKKLSNNIEPNPGPNKLKVITLNCRGLGNIDKFRLILNRCYDIMNRMSVVVMLQETMILDDNYLKMAWRGKYVLTPGTKNSKGCITLTNNDIKIEHIHHLGNRGHYFTATGLNGDHSTIIMNLYAPNGFGVDKFDFFIEAFDIIAAYDCDILIAGDLNVTLKPCDRFNRGVTQSEERLAAMILDYLDDLNLKDEWLFTKKSGIYTWKRGNTMSHLDRIFSRLVGYKHISVTTDWTFTTTDHAAVIVEYVATEKKLHRNEHIKLDDTVVKNADTLTELRTYLTEQLSYAEDMNPHMMLEYTKMTIRTKALDIMARSGRAMVSEVNTLNDDINTNITLLSRYTDVNSQLILTHDIENATIRKNAILQDQGEKLALRAKTRWYNEGEKSNKYFLNLLKRQNERNEMRTLHIDGVDVTDEKIIQQTLQSFYHDLYNKGEMHNIDGSFLDNMFTVEDQVNVAIGVPLTLTELWDNLRGLRATTPGPDGISNTYIKNLLDILGPIILQVWEYSMPTGNLPPSHTVSLL